MKKKIQCYKYDELIKTYDSIKDICQELKLNSNAIVNNLSGRSKTCGGYDFRYITIEEFSNTSPEKVYSNFHSCLYDA